jgi:hypothetical protein
VYIVIKIDFLTPKYATGGWLPKKFRNSWPPPLKPSYAQGPLGNLAYVKATCGSLASLFCNGLFGANQLALDSFLTTQRFVSSIGNIEKTM